MNHNRFLFFSGLLLLLVAPGALFASSVSINEIMYDPQGADADAQGNSHEWIEIYNGGASPIPLGAWKLFEAKTNHTITKVSGDDTVAAGGYAIIADDPTEFLADHPGFLGQVFDSSFSLSNTGETLILRDKDLNDIDTATYTKADGGAGDGNSLQWIRGGWHGAPPTPGAPSSSESGASGSGVGSFGEEGATSSEQSSSQNTHVMGASLWPTDPQVFADAGPAERSVVVGADAVFTGRVWGLKKEPIENARMQWVFGDGGSSEGHAVLHHYRYPGTYIVILTGSSGYFSGTDRVVVHAVPAQVSISRVLRSPESFIEIKNDGGEDLDLSGWFLRAATTTFEFPPNTILAARNAVVFPGDITHIAPSTETQDVTLLYPNGTTAIRYEPASTEGSTSDTKVVTERAPYSLPHIAIGDRVASSATKDPPAVATSTLGEGNLSFAGVASSGDRGSSVTLWLVAVLSLAALAVVGVIATRRQQIPAEETLIADEAAEYEIIEESKNPSDKGGTIPF